MVYLLRRKAAVGWRDERGALRLGRLGCTAGPVAEAAAEAEGKERDREDTRVRARWKKDGEPP
jgi:hypothetical protein